MLLGIEDMTKFYDYLHGYEQDFWRDPEEDHFFLPAQFTDLRYGKDSFNGRRARKRVGSNACPQNSTLTPCRVDGDHFWTIACHSQPKPLQSLASVGMLNMHILAFGQLSTLRTLKSFSTESLWG